jgi:sugar phosphate isomerase/epimerase
MQLDDAEIGEVLRAMDDYGLRVSSIGSPIGKVKLLDVDDGTGNQFFPFDRYLDEQVARVCDLAQRFDCKLIRGFSFYHPKGTRADDHVEQVADQLGQICQRCDDAGLSFGLEVEANLVGQNAELLMLIWKKVNHAGLMLIFDGANLVTQGYTTEQVVDQYKKMKPALGWIHIKDYRHPGNVERIEHVDEESLRHFVPPSIGQSGHAEILNDLKDFLPELQARLSSRGIPGFFADLEPHLKGGGQFGGYSGPDGFGIALRDFCGMLNQAGIEYDLREYPDISA